MGEREIAKLAGDLMGRLAGLVLVAVTMGSRLPTPAMPHRVFRVRREISVGAIQWAQFPHGYGRPMRRPRLVNRGSA